MNFPILYPADNTMTDVKLLRPYVMQSGKEGRQNKIDGAVGLMMGLGRAMLNSSVMTSVYDEEDIAC